MCHFVIFFYMLDVVITIHAIQINFSVNNI